MRPWIRGVLAVVAGLVVAVGIIAALEAVSGRLYPAPPGLDYGDPVAVRAFVASMPMSAALLVLVGWTVGTLAGVTLAARIDTHRPRRSGGIVAGVLLVSIASNLYFLPHPVWMVVVGAVAPPLAVVAGLRLATRSDSQDVAPNVAPTPRVG